MAEGWIKVRTLLPKDGRLLIVSRKCHVQTVTALGALVTLWSFADAHADEAGVLFGYTADDIDALVEVPGFSTALPADWIDLSGEWVKLPSYQEHNGTTAKSRAQATKRKQRQRTVTDVTNVSRNKRDASVTREEKRREELEASSHSPRAGEREDGEPPSDVQVTDGDGNPLDVPLATLTAAQSAVVVQACKHLRRMGLQGVHPERIELVRMVRGGATVATMALVAAELTMRAAEKANAQCLRGLDPPPDPDLPELLASAATAEQMHLRPEELIELKSFTPNLAYLASTLEGRWRDAQNLTTGGIRHGSGDEAGRGAGRDRRSLVERVRSNGAAGDERDRLADGGDLRGVG